MCPFWRIIATLTLAAGSASGGAFATRSSMNQSKAVNVQLQTFECDLD